MRMHMLHPATVTINNTQCYNNTEYKYDIGWRKIIMMCYIVWMYIRFKYLKITYFEYLLEVTYYYKKSYYNLQRL